MKRGLVGASIQEVHESLHLNTWIGCKWVIWTRVKNLILVGRWIILAAIKMLRTIKRSLKTVQVANGGNDAGGTRKGHW